MSAQAQALAPADTRPALRGVLHSLAAVAAVGGAVWLLLIADSARAYVGGAIFAASLILLYTTSAGYHRIEWKPAARRILKRLDHSMIWVLIGGTYTPLCLAVSLAWGIPILSVVWGVAGAGVLLKVLWPDAPRWLGVSLYVGVGWVALVGASEIVQEFAGLPVILLGLGGMFYTLGGMAYAAGWPNPWRGVFGYHEVFHAFVVAGSAAHYWVVAGYALG